MFILKIILQIQTVLINSCFHLYASYYPARPLRFVIFKTTLFMYIQSNKQIDALIHEF